MTLMSPRPRGQVDPGLLSRALESAGRLANDATDVITATAGRDAVLDTPESPFDWVTDTDHTLERHTRRVLTAEFPGIPVISSTFGAEAGSRYRWVVDPLDGTANYAAGIPWCAYSLALVDADGPVVGVVADPFRGRIYAAARSRGARVNGVRIALRDRTSVAGAIVCTELVSGGPWPGLAGFIERAGAATARVRVLGSSALAVAQVALGHAAAAVLHGCREHEVAAAVALASESGAVVLDRSGRDAVRLPADGLLVAAPGVAEQALGWWRGG
ncbi:inositol monophosphatase [Actinokineospora sp. PR83]|uniref:inositol monophosphatase family protein n=1 Tax=Actinokineospora sp. PR83 TaxID=2884908 RepID=UPI001F3CF9ED|nr:inositol monophosphatase [Actinokineospora sp. PR83]MCG8915427.1 inositol monophosphatase [Actinokineospora sp. PR83]